MSDTLTYDTSHAVDTTSHTGENMIKDMLHGNQEGATSADTPGIAAATSSAIGKAQASSAHAMAKSTKAPSKALAAMKRGVHTMTAPVTRPIQNTINTIKGKALQLVDRMKHGDQLSWKEATLVFAAPGGALILLSHYANMFSKKAEDAINAGKAKWESFLQSLGLSGDATPIDIAHAESEYIDDETKAVTHLAEDVGVVGKTHTISANDDHAHHGGQEHPGQEKQAA